MMGASSHTSRAVPYTPPSEIVRSLPYFLIDIELDTRLAYGYMLTDAGGFGQAAPLYPAAIECPTSIAALIARGERMGHDIRDGLRDLFVQGLTWSVMDDAWMTPPYHLYWSHVKPTTDILDGLRGLLLDESE